ncbi:macro domain-containing protein [Pseudomonas vranovensis]|uniref:macro domain-containing protein n=1 Tax=Pseudomonas vranovensis TaxID=321661 RepID=UPI003D97BDB6
MLTFVDGDFFDFNADIMINTVNCVGVMGAGVALAFKKRYPQMFLAYVQQCNSGQLRPGNPTTWTDNNLLSKNIEIINFPTKTHWRQPSQYSYIEDGLTWLSSHLLHRQGKIVTLPALGCGHGGLDWEIVKKLIVKHLKDSPAEILAFAPSSSKNANKDNFNTKASHPILAPANIKTIDGSYTNYPKQLRRYTSRDLYVYPSTSEFSNFDLSIICSSRPSEQERSIARILLHTCISKQKRLLLGGSAHEKKLALDGSKHGLEVACFLPTNIYYSARKLEEADPQRKVTLLSIGDPMQSFDKTEYLPSVLSRIYLAKKTIFITDRLSWLSKYQHRLHKDSIDAYFINYENLEKKDIIAATNSGVKLLAIHSLNSIF